MSVLAVDCTSHFHSAYMAAMAMNSNDDMLYRTVVNRACFGAFFAARDYAGLIGNHNMHMRVIYYYEHNKLFAISDELRDLKGLYLTSDNELGDEINMTHVQIAYAQACEIIKQINELPPRPITGSPALKWQ